MVGNENRDPDDSPQKRVDKIFNLMDEVKAPAQAPPMIGDSNPYLRLRKP